MGLQDLQVLLVLDQLPGLMDQALLERVQELKGLLDLVLSVLVQLGQLVVSLDLMLVFEEPLALELLALYLPLGQLALVLMSVHLFLELLVSLDPPVQQELLAALGQMVLLVFVRCYPYLYLLSHRSKFVSRGQFRLLYQTKSKTLLRKNAKL